MTVCRFCGKVGHNPAKCKKMDDRRRKEEAGKKGRKKK